MTTEEIEEVPEERTNMNVSDYSERIKNTVLLLNNFKELADPNKYEKD